MAGAEHVKYDIFIKLFDWIKANCRDGTGEVKLSRSYYKVEEFLNCYLNEPWIAGEAPSRGIVVQKYNSKSIESLASDVRKCLSAASAALRVGGVVKVEKQGEGRYRLFLDAPQQTPGVDAGVVSTIHLAGQAVFGGFTVDFMRGVHSMARELGVALADRRTGWNVLSRGGHGTAGPLMRMVEDEHLDPVTDSILICGHDHYELIGQIRHLTEKGFVVVSTGPAGNTIRVNSASLGRLLAGECIEDEAWWRVRNDWAGGERTVVVLDTTGYPATTSLVIVQEAFTVLLSEAGLFGFEKVTIDPSVLSSGDDELRHAISEILASLSAGQDPRQIAAILLPGDATTLAAIRALRDNDLRDARVYAERITAGLLEPLRDPNGPLRAICGAEPYYFGRYAARAASCRAQGQFPEIPPTLITKEDAREGTINTPDRIPADLRGADVRLEGAQYGWQPWMKARCPGSYGPDRRNRASR